MSSPVQLNLYFGDPDWATSRRLLLDPRLTPLQRNVLQILRTELSEDGLTSSCSYQQLLRHVASTPFGLASRTTVANALTVLRLTRWLSLPGRGTAYLLHEEPLSLDETLQVDSAYLQLLRCALEHGEASVRQVAGAVLWEDFSGLKDHCFFDVRQASP